MKLTLEDIWYFRHNGFYQVPETLPSELIDRLNNTTDKQIAHIIDPIVWESKITETLRHPGNIRRLSRIIDRDPVYLEAASHPIVLDALEGILGHNIELLTNKHNHIMVRPAGSCPVPWHSGEELHDQRLITVLIYLAASTLENGCVRIVPGSHVRPFPHPSRPSYDNFHQSDFYCRSLPVPMPRGGILLFNDCCFHGADTNSSDRSRRSMTLAYQAHSVHNVNKDDPEKILVRGKREYIGHPHPYQ